MVSCGVPCSVESDCICADAIGVGAPFEFKSGTRLIANLRVGAWALLDCVPAARLDPGQVAQRRQRLVVEAGVETCVLGVDMLWRFMFFRCAMCARDSNFPDRFPYSYEGEEVVNLNRNAPAFHNIPG